MKTEFESFGSAYSRRPVGEFDCQRAFPGGNRNELTSTAHPGPECIVGLS